MWSYYGSKTNIVHLYPAPRYNQVIEPFAGSARYSLRYFEKDILLIDADPAIVSLWHFLQNASEKDILSIPRPVAGQLLDSLPYDCTEQQNLMGFICGYGRSTPGNTVSNKYFTNRPKGIEFSLARIAANLFKIRHWNIRQGDYRSTVNIEATWFVDPPYVVGGHKYRYSNRRINFLELGEWCRGRQGQTIVCEAEGAEWLPFSKLTIQQGSAGPVNELIWTDDIKGHGRAAGQLTLF